MKVFRKVVLLVIVIAITSVIIFNGKIFGTGYTPAIVDKKGNKILGSVASLEKINLGGMEQNILIRGNDRDNPILLWLHGGPGASQMPIAYKYDKELEKEFIVVHWDQRGSGKSNPANFNENSMTYNQFITDGHDLTVYLKERFGKKKIYLLGHSWGAQLGLELADRYPEDYYSYIGVSQVTDNKLHNMIAYPWLVEQIKVKGSEKDLKKLEELGSPPFTSHNEYVKFVQLVDVYGGGFDIEFNNLLLIALKAPEYSLKDYWFWFNGSYRGGRPMWNESTYGSFNAIENIPSLNVPVYFFSGKKDYNTPLEAVNYYYEILNAPQGKNLIIFEESAHTPFLGEPQKFVKELIRVKEETYNRNINVTKNIF